MTFAPTDPAMAPAALDLAAAAGWALGIGVVTMLALYMVQRRTEDADWVDVGWAGLLGVYGVGAALTGSGGLGARWLVGAAVGIWSLRLTGYLLFTRALAPGEDGRYRSLREYWGDRAQLHFVWFFQAQSALAVLLALPFWLAAQARDPLGWAHGVGIALIVSGWVIESIADRQLAAFRAAPAHRGQVCDRGLWKYSRHPNYFGEWLIWCGFAALAWPAPHGPWALLAPAVMYLMLTRVTGIPHAERQSLRSRGERYAAYQARTSAFFPWFPRTLPTS